MITLDKETYKVTRKTIQKVLDALEDNRSSGEHNNREVIAADDALRDEILSQQETDAGSNKTLSPDLEERKMKLKLEVLGCLCEPKEFEINGVDADYSDFGSKGDISPETADEYCCGDMRFSPSEPTDDVLEKYSIDKNEYREVCEKLTEGLSFGRCGWCS